MSASAFSAFNEKWGSSFPPKTLEPLAASWKRIDTSKSNDWRGVVDVLRQQNALKRSISGDTDDTDTVSAKTHDEESAPEVCVCVCVFTRAKEKTFCRRAFLTSRGFLSQNRAAREEIMWGRPLAKRSTEEEEEERDDAAREEMPCGFFFAFLRFLSLRFGDQTLNPNPIYFYLTNFSVPTHNILPRCYIYKYRERE